MTARGDCARLKLYSSLLNSYREVSLCPGKLRCALLFCSSDSFTSFVLENLAYLRAVDTARCYPFLGIDGKQYAFPTVVAAVNGNSKNQLNAWNFIKLLLSEHYQSSEADFPFYFDFPMRKDSVAPILDMAISAAQGNSSLWVGKEARTPPEVREAFLQEALNPGGCCIFRTSVVEILWEEMTPYFEDRESYESCLARARERLTLYASE